MRQPSVRLLLLLAASLPAAALAVGDKVGPETCRACHPAAYDAWKASPHARAQDSLPERSAKDGRCLGCHAPAIEDGLAGVSCESCHGGGRMYAAQYVMRDPELARAVGLVDPGEKTCVGCHTESTPSLERFEYARKLPLIFHGDPARAPPDHRPRAGGERRAPQPPAPHPAARER